MFDFIKRLFKKEEKTEATVESPVVVHAEVGETIVIKEVALATIKPKTAKPKVTKPTAVAKGVKPAATKEVKEKVAKPKKEKVVKLSQPVVDLKILKPVAATPVKKGRPKKDKTA